MLNENILFVTDEDGNNLKIKVLFAFDIPKYNKKYVSYVVYNEDEREDDMEVNKTVLIAEMDYQTNTIKSISESEADSVLYYYNKIKGEILNESIED